MKLPNESVGEEFDAVNEDESFDDILDQLINSDDLSFSYIHVSGQVT